MVGCWHSIGGQKSKRKRVRSQRAVAQIILARVLDLRYKDGKDNN
jgi:hypothetical protein